MRYLSVCSGIEAATAAWHGLGWEAAAFSEIERFPSAVLNYRFPGVPNLGDMREYGSWDIGSIDILVGGTPCQSFSIAGLRAGLDDERGNLALIYFRIAGRYRPRWIVWENVPGVLSSHGGRDFGAILGALAELGYSFCWRILDAQYFGVPQRRRRVFVVGHLGDWRGPAAVLSEPESLRRDSSPRGATKKAVTGPLPCRTTGGGGFGTDFDLDGGLVARTLTAGGATKGSKGAKSGKDQETMIVYSSLDKTAHTLRAEGFDASEDGTGRGIPLVSSTGRISHCLNAGSMGRQDYETETMLSCFSQSVTGVRRLTPLECERLQGFPDNWTLIPYGRRGRMAKDGPRYKAIGNSMAVPVMHWIGRRIQMFEDLTQERKE